MTVIGTARLLMLASGILLGASFWLSVPPLQRNRKWLWRLVALSALWAVLGEPFFRGWQQYLAWNASEQTRYLLTETPGYIYGYSFGRFALWRWIAAVAAIVLYWLSLQFVVKPSSGQKLNRAEALLIAFGVLVAGWPGFVLYLMTLLLLYIGILMFHTMRGGSDMRFPVIIPATLALMAVPFIQHLLVWLSNTFEINLLLYNVTNLSL